MRFLQFQAGCFASSPRLLAKWPSRSGRPGCPPRVISSTASETRRGFHTGGPHGSCSWRDLGGGHRRPRSFGERRCPVPATRRLRPRRLAVRCERLGRDRRIRAGRARRVRCVCARALADTDLGACRDPEPTRWVRGRHQLERRHHRHGVPRVGALRSSGCLVKRPTVRTS